MLSFLRFAIALLQQGRSDVLRSWTRAVKGVGQQDAQRFRGALQAVGFAHENDCDCEPLVTCVQRAACSQPACSQPSSVRGGRSGS